MKAGEGSFISVLYICLCWSQWNQRAEFPWCAFLPVVIQTCHLLREKSGSREPGKKVIALFQVHYNWAVMARMERMGWGATHWRGGGDRFSNSGVSRDPKRLFKMFILSDSEWLYSLLRKFGWEMIWEINTLCLRLWRNVCVEIQTLVTVHWYGVF